MTNMEVMERAAHSAAGEMVRGLRQLAIRALRRMYRPEERLFAFRLRRARGGCVLEGISRRYTAIALIALAEEPYDVSREILGGEGLPTVSRRLMYAVDGSRDLGEVALAVWAARALNQPEARRGLRYLTFMDPVGGSYSTVQLAWVLSALTAEARGATDDRLAEATAERLMGLFHEPSSLFWHAPPGQATSRVREHVACFADLVYPIQALSFYYRRSGNTRALELARRCADRICQLQGPEGQWWWHYDIRTGRIVEKYPVYAVHQDAMAPMALSAVQAVCGRDYTGPIERGLAWLADPPETHRSLIDGRADLIWRKVARHEPVRLSRGMQAVASRVHPSLRVPGLDLVLRPGSIDYESRPYHMGWLLYAWPARPAPTASDG